MLTALCVGIPLLIGLSLDAMGPAVIASLSGMIILYLPNTGSLTNRMVTLLISAFGFMAAYALGQLFSFKPVAAVFALGLFSLTVHWLVLNYKAAPPGSFFFIMIAALSLCQPFGLEGIPTRFGLLALGLLFSTSVAMAHLLYLSTKIDMQAQPKTRSIFMKNKAADFWEAIITAVFMALSLGIGYLLELDKP